MKILHVVPVNPKGELPIFLHHQINSLNEFTESDVVLFRGSDIRVSHLVNVFLKLRDFRNSLRNADANVIHAHWGSILGLLSSIYKRKESKLVLTLRGSDVNKSLSENSIVYLLRGIFTRIAIRRSNYVIFVSDQLKTSFKFLDSRNKVIPDGISLDIFKPIPKSQAREILGWGRKDIYIIFYCGERPIDKNLLLAEQAINRLKSIYPLLQFVIVENQLTQMELAIRFAGADALLFTSHAEGSPNVVREAIACGCPVVSVDVGDVKTWIEASGAGATCRYDALELSNALRRVIEREQRSDYKIAVNYSIQTIAKNILNIYRELDG